MAILCALLYNEKSDSFRAEGGAMMSEMHKGLGGSFISAAEIMEKYGFPPEELQNAAAEYEHFRVVVPFIGAFNTGKSSVINALLDTSLLLTGITANTTVPTELVYGENRLTVFRGEERQIVGIHELRDRTLDLTDVNMIRLELDNPFLRELSGIMMVDMPGLDSGIAQHEKVLRGYLPRSLAYILTFSADEPVIKKSVSNFLSELRLRELPVYVVLTKCDKVPEETAARAKEYLADAIRNLLGVENAEVCCVRSKFEKDVSGLRALLLELQLRADRIRDGIYKERFLRCCRPAEAYLRQRIAGERLTVSELEGRIRQLQAGMELRRGEIEKESGRFRSELPGIVEAIRQKAFESLREIKSAMVSETLAGKYAWAGTDRILSGVLAAGAESEYSAAMLRHLGAVAAILSADLDDAGDAAGRAAAELTERFLAEYSAGKSEVLEEQRGAEIRPQDFFGNEKRPEKQNFFHPPRRREPTAVQTADPAAKAVLDRFLGTRDIFEWMPAVPIQATRGARERFVQKALLDKTLPELLQYVSDCVNIGLSAETNRVENAISDAVIKDYRAREQALADIRREKSDRDTEQEQTLYELKADSDALSQLVEETERLVLTENSEDPAKPEPLFPDFSGLF